MQTYPVTSRDLGQPYIVVGCIVKKDNHYLLVKEAGTDGGNWAQPGGWLDMGEAIPDGAIRETKEETGLDVKLVGFLGVYTTVKTFVGAPLGFRQPVHLIFAAEVAGGSISFNEKEIAEVRWFTAEEIKTLSNLRYHDIVAQIDAYEHKRLFPVSVATHFSSQLE